MDAVDAAGDRVRDAITLLHAREHLNWLDDVRPRFLDFVRVDADEAQLRVAGLPLVFLVQNVELAADTDRGAEEMAVRELIFGVFGIERAERPPGFAFLKTESVKAVLIKERPDFRRRALRLIIGIYHQKTVRRRDREIVDRIDVLMVGRDR